MYLALARSSRITSAAGGEKAVLVGFRQRVVMVGLEITAVVYKSCNFISFGFGDHDDPFHKYCFVGFRRKDRL